MQHEEGHSEEGEHDEHRGEVSPREANFILAASGSPMEITVKSIPITLLLPHYVSKWYDLAVFGKLKLSIDFYIDSLTVAMFCMVAVIASCVHFYAMGYMHDELHDFTDPEVTLSSGEKLKRPGRYLPVLPVPFAVLL